MSVTLPQSLLETLQSAFQGEAKRLCRDAAKLLRVPEKEIYEKIFPPGSKVKLAVVDDSSVPLTCPAFLHEGTLLRRCRHPCLLGTGRCLQHQTTHIPSIPESIQQLTRLEPIEGQPPLWCNEATGDILDQEGAYVGKLKDGSLYLFTLDTGQ